VLISANKAQRTANIFYKGLVIEPNLASFSPTKTGEPTIAPGLKGKLHPLLQLHADRSFTGPSQFFFVDAIFRVRTSRISAISCGSVAAGLRSEAGVLSI
jgi:hypothetical protein